MVRGASAGAAAPKPAEWGRGRRRWPWSVLVVLVLLLAAIAYGLWWLSGRIGDTVAVPKPDAGYPITIASVVDDRVAYSGVPEAVTDEGAYALRTADGAYVQTVDPVVAPDGTTTRTVVAKVSPPALEAGARATLDSWYFGNDPEQALGLAFEDVNYATPLGPAGAWVIPGKSSTWVVYVHGRGDSPGQGLRLAQTVSPLGYPMMLIRYRNDPMAPEGSGYAHFGSDEWMDLEGAIGYALEHGADRIVLAGSGMGGAISLAFLENSSFADAVVGAVFDAPAVDIGATVEQEASDMGIPSFVIPLAQQVASWRYGLDWAAMDYVSRAQEVDIPILITQGTDDTTVLPASVESFAAAVPGARVRVEEFDGAGHTLAWNVDPARFDAVVSDFLSGAAPAR